MCRIYFIIDQYGELEEKTGLLMSRGIPRLQPQANEGIGLTAKGHLKSESMVLSLGIPVVLEEQVEREFSRKFGYGSIKEVHRFPSHSMPYTSNAYELSSVIGLHVEDIKEFSRYVNSLNDLDTGLPAFFISYGKDLISIKERGKMCDFVERHDIQSLDPQILVVHGRQSTTSGADFINGHPFGFYWFDNETEDHLLEIGESHPSYIDLIKDMHSICGAINGELITDIGWEEELRDEGIVLSTSCDTERQICGTGLRLKENAKDYNVEEVREILSKLPHEFAGPFIMPAIFDSGLVILTDMLGQRPGVISRPSKYRGVYIGASSQDAIYETFRGDIPAKDIRPIGAKASIYIKADPNAYKNLVKPVVEVTEKPLIPLRIEDNKLIVDGGQLVQIDLGDRDLFKHLHYCFGVDHDHNLDKTVEQALMWGNKANTYPLGAKILQRVVHRAILYQYDIQIDDCRGTEEIGNLPVFIVNGERRLTINGGPGRKLLLDMDAVGGQFITRVNGNVDEEALEATGPRIKTFIDGNAQKALALLSRSGTFITGHAAASAGFSLHSSIQSPTNRALEPWNLENVLGKVTNYVCIGGACGPLAFDTMYGGVGIVMGYKDNPDEQIFAREYDLFTNNAQGGITYFNSKRVNPKLGKNVKEFQLTEADRLLLQAIVDDIQVLHNEDIGKYVGNLNDYRKVLPIYSPIRVGKPGAKFKDHRIILYENTGQEVVGEHLRAVDNPEKLGLSDNYNVIPNSWPLLVVPEAFKRKFFNPDEIIVPYPVVRRPDKEVLANS